MTTIRVSLAERDFRRMWERRNKAELEPIFFPLAAAAPGDLVHIREVNGPRPSRRAIFVTVREVLSTGTDSPWVLVRFASASNNATGPEYTTPWAGSGFDTLRLTTLADGSLVKYEEPKRHWKRREPAHKGRKPRKFVYVGRPA